MTNPYIGMSSEERAAQLELIQQAMKADGATGFVLVTAAILATPSPLAERLLLTE